MIRGSRPALAGALTAAVAALAASTPAAAAALPFAVTHRIELAGGPPIAALTFAPDGKLAYAAAGTELRSFDVTTGAPREVVKVPGEVVGLVAAPQAGGTLYAAVRAPARLVVLGLHPLALRASYSLRSGAPSALLYEPAEHALYVESRAGHSVARLDPDDGKTIAVAHLQGDPAQMAGDGRGTLYVANAARDAIDVIATEGMSFTGAIGTPSCHAPTGLDLDRVGRRLFVACSNGIALVVDTDMGFAFEQLSIQQGTALRTVFGFHPGGPAGWKGGAFIAGDGPVLDGIRMNAFISYTSGGSMALPGQATALAMSPSSAQLWVALVPRHAAPDEAAGDAARRQAGAEIMALGASGGAQ